MYTEEDSFEILAKMHSCKINEVSNRSIVSHTNIHRFIFSVLSKSLLEKNPCKNPANQYEGRFSSFCLHESISVPILQGSKSQCENDDDKSKESNEETKTDTTKEGRSSVEREHLSLPFLLDIDGKINPK